MSAARLNLVNLHYIFMLYCSKILGDLRPKAMQQVLINCAATEKAFQSALKTSSNDRWYNPGGHIKRVALRRAGTLQFLALHYYEILFIFCHWTQHS